MLRRHKHLFFRVLRNTVIISEMFTSRKFAYFWYSICTCCRNNRTRSYCFFAALLNGHVSWCCRSPKRGLSRDAGRPWETFGSVRSFLHLGRLKRRGFAFRSVLCSSRPHGWRQEGHSIARKFNTNAACAVSITCSGHAAKLSHIRLIDRVMSE